MISLESRPVLTSKARLHYDRHAQRHMLLYPEKGLVLNETAVAILQLCDGERAVAEIVRQLRSGLHSTSPEQVERDVLTFLLGLEQRSLIREAG